MSMKMKRFIRTLFSLALALILVWGSISCLAEADPAQAEAPAGDHQYTLEQVVILSRHNLRAPLSSNGSVPSDLTPHSWINWNAKSSELTPKGGVEETGMGQYFRKWLDAEGLIPENSIPEEGEVRFSARDKQRCRATARYFASGMLPLADVEVEYPGDAKGNVDFMKPVLHFYSDAYAADATAQAASLGGDAGFEGLEQQTRDVIKLIMDTVDMQDSEIYQSGKYGDLLKDGSGYKMEADMSTALEIRHGAPLVAVNIAHPLLQELEKELKNEKRKFSFFCAHDVTVLGTLSALGAELVALPDSIETKTPVGVKLMFERRRDRDGQAWYRVSMVYRSTDQIRSNEILTPDNPPRKVDLTFESVETNGDGLISEADFFALLDRAIGAFDTLEAAYAPADAA